MESIWLPRSEEDAILEAALRFLEDDHDLGGFVQAGNKATASETGSMRTYKRRNMQIEALREEAKELEKSIEAMRSREKVKTTVSDMYGAVVARQLSQRLRAEAENQHLRELIQEQEALLRCLERLMVDREAQVKRSLGWRGRTEKPVTSTQEIVPSDSAPLDSVTSALLSMFYQTQWALSHPELQPSGRGVIYKKIPGIERPALHVLDSRVVPFGWESTTEAVWANQLSQLGSQVEACQTSGRFLRSQHEKVVVEMPGFRGFVRMTMALQRFDEGDRVVFVRNSVFTYLDPDGHNGYVVFPGLTVRHSLWTIVQRLQIPSLSRIQTVGVSTPAFTPKSEAQKAELDRYLMDLCQQFSSCVARARRSTRV